MCCLCFVYVFIVLSSKVVSTCPGSILSILFALVYLCLQLYIFVYAFVCNCISLYMPVHLSLLQFVYVAYNMCRSCVRPAIVICSLRSLWRRLAGPRARPTNKCALARIMWLLFVGRPLGLALGRTLMGVWKGQFALFTRRIKGYTQGSEKRRPSGKWKKPSTKLRKHC